jgi:hypothetical protein
MSKFDQTELSVCLVCIHILANGEFNDGTDAAEKCSAKMVAIWGSDTQHISAGDKDLGFCTSSCDTCGDTYHGDRFQAIALIPK